MSKYKYPSKMTLNENLYLIDTSVWIDIALQIYDLTSFSVFREMTGIQSPSVSSLLNRIFKNVNKPYKLYVSDQVRYEYIDVFSRDNIDKTHLKRVPVPIRKLVFSYMESLGKDDAYIISSDSQLLTRDVKKGEKDMYSGDRKIFVSGRSRYIGNIVTQDWDDFKDVRSDLYDKYNPKIYRCTDDIIGIFNGLELKGGNMTAIRKLESYPSHFLKPLAVIFLEHFERVKEKLRMRF